MMHSSWNHFQFCINQSTQDLIRLALEGLAFLYVAGVSQQPKLIYVLFPSFSAASRRTFLPILLGRVQYLPHPAGFPASKYDPAKRRLELAIRLACWNGLTLYEMIKSELIKSRWWEYRVSWGEEVKSEITRYQETLLKWHSLLSWARNHSQNDQQENQETGEVSLAKGGNPFTESGTMQCSPIVLCLNMLSFLWGSRAAVLTSRIS